MDIDNIVDVPDTPDRLTTRIFFQKSSSDNENRRQIIPIHSEQQKFVEEVTQIRPMNTENGKKRLISRLPKSVSSSSNSLRPKNIPVDLTDRINHRSEARKRTGLANGPSSSSSHGPKKISTSIENSNEGTGNMSRIGSIIGNGNREAFDFNGNGQTKPCNNDSNVSPRINRQKRLVRNGCISPSNIAKAKEFSGKEINGSKAVVQNNNASLGSSSSPVSVDIMDLVADNDNSYKGKGKAVVFQPCPLKELDSRNKLSLGRSSLSINDKLKETNDYNKGVGPSIEETGGWISTHGPRKTSLSSSDEDQVIISEMNEPKYAHQPHHTRTGRSGKGISIRTSVVFTENPNMPSSDHSGISQPLGQPKSNPTLTTRVRKLKLESASSSFNECSTSVRDDPEVVLLSSPTKPSTSRTTSRRLNNLQPVIEVEEFSPELRNNRNEQEARVRQLEADERLARELQEQFYNETPAFGTGELDEHIALALQHQDDGLAPPPHRSTRAASNARGSRASNVNREPPLSSSNVSRRGAHTRAAALERMTRLRSRFPGRARTTLPTAGSTSLFPPNMDMDMRVHMLEVMEAMGVGHGLLQTQRDFNENDYEMLLALDDNIDDQRGGASARVINGLPQSTVQSTTCEETCAVCLETPTIGDTIRHLPCLHKFHKDCIDPWLRRKTSCPVCKSSVS